jgi:hypothetical protein
VHLKPLSLRSKSISQVCWFWFNTPQQLHMQKYNKNCTTVDNVDKPQLGQYLSSGLALNILKLQLDFQRAHHPTLHPQPLLGQEKPLCSKIIFSSGCLRSYQSDQVLATSIDTIVDTQVQAYIPDQTRPDHHWFVSQTRTQILSNKAYYLQCFLYWQNFTIFWERNWENFVFLE